MKRDATVHAPNCEARHQGPYHSGNAGHQRGPVDLDPRLHEVGGRGCAGFSQSLRIEVEDFALQKNVLDSVLRAIPLRRKFAKNYTIMRNLVLNPRTPIDASLLVVERPARSRFEEFVR